MARTEQQAVIHEPATVSFSQDEYLKDPSKALSKVSSGHRVEVLAPDGSPHLVIYPGTIADIASRD